MMNIHHSMNSILLFLFFLLNLFVYFVNAQISADLTFDIKKELEKLKKEMGEDESHKPEEPIHFQPDTILPPPIFPYKFPQIKANDLSECKGKFLVATPLITGFFYQSVILMIEHSAENGSIGLVLNMPFTQDIINIHQSIRIGVGGPVQIQMAIVLHNKDDLPGATKVLNRVNFQGDEKSILEILTSPPTGTKGRLLLGYSGWASYQLDNEYLRNSWILCNATYEKIFEIKEEELWSSLFEECDIMKEKWNKYK